MMSQPTEGASRRMCARILIPNSYIFHAKKRQERAVEERKNENVKRHKVIVYVCTHTLVHLSVLLGNINNGSETIYFNTIFQCYQNLTFFI